MRIDASHRNWAAGTGLVLVLAGILFAWYVGASSSVGGPKGDSWVGLGYGIAGGAMVLCAGFLAIRKKVLLWRIGPMAWWMKGHLWLGALSLPLVLFHSAFRMGGALTTALMILMIITVSSGIVVALLQHFLPIVMTGAIDSESTHEQIGREMQWLRVNAYDLIATECGPIAAAAQERSEFEALKGRAASHKDIDQKGEQHAHLKSFYETHVLHYLRNPASRRYALGRSNSAPLLFDGLRETVGSDMTDTVTQLIQLCDGSREKVKQARMYALLHGLILIHVPPSIALVILMGVHAVRALCY
jgi:hypothetical protein